MYCTRDMLFLEKRVYLNLYRFIKPTYNLEVGRGQAGTDDIPSFLMPSLLLPASLMVWFPRILPCSSSPFPLSPWAISSASRYTTYTYRWLPNLQACPLGWSLNPYTPLLSGLLPPGCPRETSSQHAKSAVNYFCISSFSHHIVGSSQKRESHPEC